MTREIRHIWRWLADEPHHRTGLRVLQIAIGWMLMFRIFTEGKFAPYLFGPRGIGRGSTVPLLGPAGIPLDLSFRTELGTYGVLLVLAIGALGLIYGIRTRLATFLALVPFFMLEQRLPEIGDGGDNVTRLVLVYMLFALGREEKTAPGGLRVWLHNIAIVAIIAQLFVVYETSGMMKVIGEKWHGGTAMYYISQVEWFGHPLTREIFKNPIAVTLATFFPIVFLVFFPLAVFTRLKPVWICSGICFHTGIAFAMGLVTFAIVMIGLELLLITDPEYERLRSRFGGAWAAIRRRAHATGWGTRAVDNPVAVLYIDGHCPKCRAAGRRIAALDVTRNLEIRSFRHDSTYEGFGISLQALERRMHVVELVSGRISSGFSSLRVLTRAVPLLFVFRPFCSLMGTLRVGDGLYDWLANRRVIIPDPSACGETSCQVAVAQRQEI